MRLNTAKTYLGLLGDGLGPMSYAQGAQVRLSAHYEGIGPVFRIKLELQNTGKLPIMNTRISLNYKENIYRQRGNQRCPLLPLMLPNMTYKINVEIECVDPTGANDLVRVVVMGPDSTLPLISANI